MDRCWLRGATGDALHAVLCAAGYNLRWLLRAMVRLGLRALLLGRGFVVSWLRFLGSQPAGNVNTLRYAFVQAGLGGVR
jgi:hypothetical protein